MTATILFWVVWNIFAPANLRFDEYPFIFLTLALSLQASYAAPLILLAQNRQESRDRVQYERDRDVDARTRADMEFLAREMAVAADVRRRGRHPRLPPLRTPLPAGRSRPEGPRGRPRLTTGG